MWSCQEYCATFSKNSCNPHGVVKLSQTILTNLKNLLLSSKVTLVTKKPLGRGYEFF